MRQLLAPATHLLDGRFGGDGPELLLAGNASHADVGLDAPVSGFVGLLLTMLGQTVGFPAPTGGAGALTQALRRRFEAAGGTVACSTPVTGIRVEGRRAVAVQTADAEVRVRRAVLADVGAEQLFGGLVAADDLPARTTAEDGRVPARPGHVQGRLRARRSGPVGRDARVRPRHGARRRLGGRR